MIPAPPLSPEAALEAQKREEARRQADGGDLDGLADAAELGADLLSLGVLDVAAQAAGAVADAAGAALGATAEAAKVSIEVVGGLLSGLDGL